MPQDVLYIADLLVDRAQQIAERLELKELPQEKRAFSGKTPTQVFGAAISAFIKLDHLCGNRSISPDEVDAQMQRASEDVRSILRQTDPACRYRVDIPAVDPGRTPRDVLRLCLEIRALINDHREASGMPRRAVPALPDRDIKPIDPFIQTQILIADLNLLKIATHTNSSTPLAIQVEGMTPTDVYRSASLIQYLLKQVQIAGKANVALSASAVSRLH